MGTSKRIAAASLAPLALALVSAGCGGGSEPLSADQLVAKGDQLCAQGRQRFAAIQAVAPASAAGAVDQTAELISVSKEELDGLRELEPPADLEMPFNRYLEARERAIGYLERGRAAAERHDRQAYATAQGRSIATRPERRRLARAVGFQVCGARDNRPAS